MIEPHLLTAYHTPLMPHVFGIIHDSDWVEASEFLRGLWLPLVGALLGIGAIAAWTLRSLWRSKLAWRGRSRWLALAGIVCAGSAAHLLYERQEDAVKGLVPPSDELSIKPSAYLLERVSETSPFGLSLRYVYYRRTLAALSRVESRLADCKFGVVPSAPTRERQIYVFVIGESARFDHWGVNGYERATSPRLSAEPHLITLTNVVSVTPNTRLAVPILLTRKPATQAQDFAFAERSLISAFKEAHFATYWLSNQAMIGYHDTPVALYAQEADHVAYLNLSDVAHDTPFDGVLLKPLKEVLAKAEPRQLIVLHTLGRHVNYRQRYPDAFNVFLPAPSREAPVGIRDAAQAERIANAYDNSILYSDWFLSQVIAAIKQSGNPIGAMLYVSDHGEDLVDPACSNHGHGRPTRANYRVPMFSWYSDAYATRFGSRLRALDANRHAALTSETVFHTLRDAADIHFPSENPQRSAMSAKLKPWPRIVTTFSGTLDFDRAKVNAQCELVE